MVQRTRSRTAGGRGPCHDRPEVLGEQRHGLGDESRAGARHHEGKDRFSLGRDHRQGRLATERPNCWSSNRRVEVPPEKRERDLTALDGVERVSPPGVAPGGRMKTSSWVPKADGCEVHRDIDGVGQTDLARAGMLQPKRSSLSSGAASLTLTPW